MSGRFGLGLAVAAADILFLGRYVGDDEYRDIRARQERKRMRERIERRIPNYRKKGPGRRHMSGDFDGRTNTRGWK